MTIEKGTKILLVDDHDLVRKGLNNLLQESSDNQFVIHEATDGDEAVKMTKALDYDVILMDITMPKMSGIESTREILRDAPNTNVLALSMHDEYSYVSDMIDCGAKGYVLKNAPIEELMLAIETVCMGRKFFSGEISEQIYTHSKTPSNKELPLTTREKEIFHLIVNGLTSLEISKKLNISKRTVDNHRNSILSKMMVKNTTELVKMAYERGLTN